MGMTRIATVTNDMGVPFNVTLVRKGDRYGLRTAEQPEGVLVHDKADPLVEFYDARYPHTEHGQFVSRYNLSILLGDDGVTRPDQLLKIENRKPWLQQPAEACQHGLLLDGGVISWRVTGPNMLEVYIALLKHAKEV